MHSDCPLSRPSVCSLPAVAAASASARLCPRVLFAYPAVRCCCASLFRGVRTAQAAGEGDATGLQDK
jgi:hypothetical protein